MNDHWEGVIGQISCSHVAHFKLEHNFIWGSESAVAEGPRLGPHRLQPCQSRCTPLGLSFLICNFLLFVFKDLGLFFFQCVCVCLSVSVCLSVCEHKCRYLSLPEASGSLELELQAAMSCLTQVLGTKLASS